MGKIRRRRKRREVIGRGIEEGRGRRKKGMGRSSRRSKRRRKRGVSD